jgi:two-component sensor histidine kinase
VVLTGLRLFNEPVRPGRHRALPKPLWEAQSITLTHRERVFSLDFAALHYRNPARNRYAYRLEGHDDAWRDPDGQRSVTYSNLNPGTYVFRLKAASSDGVWDEEGVSLRIVIQPPWWRTWWFRLLALGMTIGLLSVGHRYRVAHLLALERTRGRIADDLHDDIGSKMSSIALMIDVATQGERLSEAARGRLQEASQAARRTVDDLRDTVWVIDAGQDRLPDLVARMEKVAHQMLQGRCYRVELPPQVPPVPLAMEQRRHLLLVYKEALHNAIRHGHAPSLAVRITAAEGLFSFEVADDGVGFDSRQPGGGRGLKTMTSRAERLGARLTLASEPGKGTRVSLSMPIP